MPASRAIIGLAQTGARGKVAVMYRSRHVTLNTAAEKKLRSEQITNDTRCARQGCVELRGVFAAGFGEIGPAAAGAADFLGEEADDFACL